MPAPTKQQAPALNRGAEARASVLPTQNQYSSIEQALVDALAAYGVTGLAIRADGALHRFDSADKPKGNRNGWYVCPSLEVGVYGFWHTGEQHTIGIGGEIDPTAAAEARLAYQRAREKREEEQRQQHANTADQTRCEWPLLVPASPTHAYLATKGVKPHNLRQMRGLLVVPLTDGHRLVNWQTIAPDGSKYFQTGGKVKGCYSPIGNIVQHQPLLIAEGWATAATLHEATGYAVAAAMNAGNLLPVAKSLRERYPTHPIIVCADNDHGTTGNPGVTKGKEAASAIGARCVWPETHEGVTDFNDLSRLGGGLAL